MSKTTLTPVSTAMTPQEIVMAFYGYQATLLRSWADGADPDAFFAGALDLQGKADYLAFRDALRGSLRALGETQTGLARRTRTPGGDPEAQMRRAQLRGIITALIGMRRAGKAWSASQARRRAAEAA
jgi:hypothetical protein